MTPTIEAIAATCKNVARIAANGHGETRFNEVSTSGEKSVSNAVTNMSFKRVASHVKRGSLPSKKFLRQTDARSLDPNDQMYLYWINNRATAAAPEAMVAAEIFLSDRICQ